MRVFTVFEILATCAVPLPNFNQKKVQRAAPSFYRVGPPSHSSVEGNAEKIN